MTQTAAPVRSPVYQLATEDGSTSYAPGSIVPLILTVTRKQIIGKAERGTVNTSLESAKYIGLLMYAVREGDAAVGRVVSALGQKEFVEAFEALEAARDAFMRAGPEVETARSQTIDNLYGYIRAETERNEKLARLVRMKEVLKKKADLKLQDELDERRAGGFES
mgnify:CR=1 FL=1